MKNNRRPSKFRGLGLPLISAAIALLGIISGYVLHSWDERSRVVLKTFEVTFPQKQQGYASLMRLLSDSFYTAAWRDEVDHYQFIHELEVSYFGLEPFLSDVKRKIVWKDIQEFIGFCDRIRWSSPTTDMEIEEVLREFAGHRDSIRASIFSELFDRRFLTWL